MILPKGTQYIGDGIYVAYNDYEEIHLFACDGMSILDEVFLESPALLELIRCLASIGWAKTQIERGLKLPPRPFE